MTPATREKLNALLGLLQAERAQGDLIVLSAFDDTAADRRRIGAALRMQHDNVPLERLGALAHQAGFDYVKHVPVPDINIATPYVYASIWRGENLGSVADPEIVDYGLFGPSDPDEVAEGCVRQLCLRPDVLAWTPPPEGEEEYPKHLAPLPQDARYDWCLKRYGPGSGRLDSPTERHCKLFTAQEAGVVGVRGEFGLGDAPEPYRFELVVQPDGQSQVPPLPKPVYDDLMNFLEFRHPVGVEAHTLDLRQHVAELAEDPQLSNAGTEYTYPRYRQVGGTVDRGTGNGESNAPNPQTRNPS